MYRQLAALNMILDQDVQIHELINRLQVDEEYVVPS
jgi:hypothetical protein